MLSVFCFAMEPVIIISYILLFVMIPIGLLLISVKVFGEGTRPLTIFGKLLLSFVVHFAASIFALFFVISIVFSINRKVETVEADLTAQTICLLVIAAYGFVGWLLCSFISGKFVKSYRAFSSFSEKTPSIFQR